MRKTSTLPKYIAEGLEKYSRKTNTKQSQIVANLLDEFLTKHQAINQLTGIFNRILTNINTKDIRAIRAKKYYKDIY